MKICRPFVANIYKPSGYKWPKKLYGTDLTFLRKYYEKGNKKIDEIIFGKNR